MDDIKAYGNVSLGDIIKEAHTRSQEQNEVIQGLVDTMSEKIDDTDDIMMVMPVIQDILGISVKNNEQLVKIARVVQRAAADSQDPDEVTQGEGFSMEEKKELKQIAEQMDVPDVEGFEMENKTVGEAA